MIRYNKNSVDYNIPYRKMFKQFLQVNLKQPHDKQKYALKRNQFVLREEAQVVKFDSILYSSEDIMSKIVYEILNVVSKNKNVERPSVTVTFNYDIKANDLILFFNKIMEVKPFHSFQFAHFQIKHGHISDYCKNSTKKTNVLIDDLDQFQKDINNSLKLDRIWKINQYLCFKPLSATNLNQEFSSKSVKFGKRTNQFFVLEINKNIRIILILLPRSRQMVFTRQEERQIEELYILTKHAQRLEKKTMCFNTYVAQIISNYLQSSQLNFFVSCYPQQEKPLAQVFRLPLRLSHPCDQEIRSIEQAYNKDKWSQLQQEFDRAKKRLKQTQYCVKSEEDSMQRLIKIFTKTFNSTFPNIEYLKKKGVTNINQHISWLKRQIKLKQEEIQAQQNALKQIQKQIIIQERQHLFYVSKIEQYKLTVENDQKQKRATATPASIKIKNDSFAGKDSELTEQELFFLYDPVKQANRYREKKEEQMKKRLNACPEKKQFMKILEQAKQRLGFDEYNAFQEEYYDLISNE